MKDFFKNVLSTIVGVFIVGIISFVLFFFIIGIIAGSSSESFVLKDKTVLTIKLDGTIQDRAPVENPFYELIGMSEGTTIGLDDILSAIQKAKENDKVKGIYIQAGALSASPASLQEIRNTLIDFKLSGKFVVAYGDNYLQSCYYLASVADKVIMNPQGGVDIHGFSASPVFYKGLMDKLGIEMQIFKVGTYKSAVEPYILDKMSDANKEQVGSFINDIWSGFSAQMAESRKLSVDQINTLADTLTIFQNSTFLVDNGVVDTLLYETEVSNYLKTLVDIKEKDKLATASVSNMSSVPFKEASKAKEQIAILYAEGSIVSGSANALNTGEIVDKAIVKELEKLKDDENVKAVVFRINSGGGSAYASEQIWKAVTDLKAKKPIVVSMGDYAASGGYYIACNASKIIAQPTTLTGSIGIFGMFPNVEGLTKKIGLSFDNVKTNKFSDFGDASRPMREDEKRLLQTYIERGYDLFLTRCAEGRGVSKDSLATIAEGRVWTGNQALKIGLVDAIGGIDDAVKEAAKLAELEKYSTKTYPRKADFFEMFMNSSKDDMVNAAVKEYLGEDYVEFKKIKDIKNFDYVQARLPYQIQIK